MVEHNVGAASVGERLHALDRVLLRIVDRMSGATRAHEAHFSAEPAVPITLAPASRATSISAVPTPPAAP